MTSTHRLATSSTRPSNVTSRDFFRPSNRRSRSLAWTATSSTTSTGPSSSATDSSASWRSSWTTRPDAKSIRTRKWTNTVSIEVKLIMPDLTLQELNVQSKNIGSVEMDPWNLLVRVFMGSCTLNYSITHGFVSMLHVQVPGLVARVVQLLEPVP